VVYVWIRRTLDWTDEAAFCAQLSFSFRPRVALWDEVFDLPYHRFRAELRRIAADNHARIDGVRVVVDWAEIPDGALVLPVDDDEWFAPDVGHVLRADEAPDLLGLYWKASFLEVPFHFRHQLGVLWRSLLDDPPRPFVLTTNNYALRRRDELRPLLASHVRASAWLRATDPARVRRIPRRLSLMNRTLASQTTLRMLPWNTRRTSLVRKYHRYRVLYRHELPSGLEWAAPSVARMNALMASLNLREK
jgi:hypothetical protein